MRGWPDLWRSISMSMGAIGMLAYMIHRDEKDLRFKDRPFKRHYTVYRPDDPRIENLKARPHYYNPEGSIPDPLDTKPEYHGWQGKTSNPTFKDGSYSKDISFTLNKPT